MEDQHYFLKTERQWLEMKQNIFTEYMPKIATMNIDFFIKNGAKHSTGQEITPATAIKPKPPKK
jgi:hypothetical protein